MQTQQTDIKKLAPTKAAVLLPQDVCLSQKVKVELELTAKTTDN